MKRIVAMAALALAGVGANAELMNISAVGNQTGEQDVAACTIVDSGTTLVSGAVLLVAFAEARGDNDPDIRAWSLDRDYVTTNNNWADGIDVSANGQTGHINLREVDPNGGLLYPTLLRAPYNTRDAAVFIAANRGERICVQSFDRSGSGKANFVTLAITDINALTFKSGQLKSDQSLAERNLHLVIQNTRK
jgi:hypothetical protein